MDLERSKCFYREIIQLEEIERPDFPYPGAWFQFGNGLQLHIVVQPRATLRSEKPIDAYDVHFAMRVKSYRETLEMLHAKGFNEDATEHDLQRMILRPNSITGYPQIYILDPDRNVIEFNCEKT